MEIDRDRLASTASTIRGQQEKEYASKIAGSPGNAESRLSEGSAAQGRVALPDLLHALATKSTHKQLQHGKKVCFMMLYVWNAPLLATSEESPMRLPNRSGRASTSAALESTDFSRSSALHAKSCRQIFTTFFSGQFVHVSSFQLVSPPFNGS